ncbi:MAG: hypothetical protein R3F21_23345 [Myxococcota bacterium]
MRRLESKLLVVAIVLATFGCTRSPGGIAPSNIPLEQGGYNVLGPVQASDCKVNLFGLLPVSGGNHIADAMRKAQAKRPGTDALIDISVDRAMKFFILWSQVCTEVRATAVDIP